MRFPFDGTYPKTQEWNDERYRASYAQFGILGHNGQDFGLPSGTRVLAPHDGKIIEAQFDAAYGWYVKIENAFEGSVLAHFGKAPSVSVGQSVIAGNEVGFSDNTGNSTAPHLHWGYYRIPRRRNNGFLGYIDQTDWMNVVTGAPPVDITPYTDKISQLTAELTQAKVRIENAKVALG